MFTPPNSPGNPPPRSGVDQQFFLLVSGQFMTFPGLFIVDPLKPPMGPLGSESEMIVKVVICFTVEPLYLKHASNHKLRLPKLVMLSIRIRHYIVLL